MNLETIKVALGGLLGLNIGMFFMALVSVLTGSRNKNHYVSMCISMIAILCLLIPVIRLS